MGKLSRKGQVVLEVLLFLFFCLALLNVFQRYEDTLKAKQKTYRWEKKRGSPKNY